MRSSRRQSRVLSCVIVAAVALAGCGKSGTGSATEPATTDGSRPATTAASTDRDPARLYCNEHARYEDECFICHPELAETRVPADTPAGLFCNEHRVEEAECGICQPQLAADLEPGGELKVRFESPSSASKAGVQTVVARASSAQASVRAFCEVTFNENALAHITPLAEGIVRAVFVDVGADVKAGDALVELHSAEVASAKAALVAATVDFELKRIANDREQRLAQKNISSERAVQEADAAFKTAEITLSTARQRLLNYGLTAQEVEAVASSRDTSALLLVRAPFDATLVERTAVPGEIVRPGEPLFAVADLSSMWLTLSIPADRADLIRVEQPGMSRMSGMQVEATLAGEEVRGKVTWISTSIDHKSRMLRARAVLDNTQRRLSAGVFGDARILVGDVRNAVDVPREALQWLDENPHVFVRLEDDLYALRRVAIAQQPSTDTVAVVEGLRPGEPVVVTGGFTVLSEFLKSRLGAGCVDD